jgi:lipopolysaccharide export LptBFGC system permease protein LptF
VVAVVAQQQLEQLALMVKVVQVVVDILGLLLEIHTAAAEVAAFTFVQALLLVALAVPVVAVLALIMWLLLRLQAHMELVVEAVVLVMALLG